MIRKDLIDLKENQPITIRPTGYELYDDAMEHAKSFKNLREMITWMQNEYNCPEEDIWGEEHILRVGVKKQGSWFFEYR